MCGGVISEVAAAFTADYFGAIASIPHDYVHSLHYLFMHTYTITMYNCWRVTHSLGTACYFRTVVVESLENSAAKQSCEEWTQQMIPPAATDHLETIGNAFLLICCC